MKKSEYYDGNVETPRDVLKNGLRDVIRTELSYSFLESLRNAKPPEINLPEKRMQPECV